MNLLRSTMVLHVGYYRQCCMSATTDGAACRLLRLIDLLQLQRRYRQRRMFIAFLSFVGQSVAFRSCRGRAGAGVSHVNNVGSGDRCAVSRNLAPKMCNARILLPWQPFSKDETRPLRSSVGGGCCGSTVRWQPRGNGQGDDAP